MIEKQFKVICVKNSFNSKLEVKKSGFRDLKLLIEVTFDDLQLEGVSRAQSKTTFICEIQILCKAWLINKKTTRFSYKIFRAETFRDLLMDASKYAKGRSIEVSEVHKDVTEILKSGWLNLAKAADFTTINADTLLLTAAEEDWDVAEVKMLVEKLEANKEA